MNEFWYGKQRSGTHLLLNSDWENRTGKISVFFMYYCKKDYTQNISRYDYY